MSHFGNCREYQRISPAQSVDCDSHTKTSILVPRVEQDMGCYTDGTGTGTGMRVDNVSMAQELPFAEHMMGGCDACEKKR